MVVCESSCSDLVDSILDEVFVIYFHNGRVTLSSDILAGCCSSTLYETCSFFVKQE